MIIKSHIRGGYKAAAEYLKNIGKNEKTRVVEISDPDAKDLDEAFHNMWTVAANSKAKKPLHHISINPFKDERLTDEQVLRIVNKAEEVYGYKHGEHQRVIVEHIKDGRQHFHVMWNRVSLETGKAVWPGLHWNKSKQIAREMEKELGLKRPIPRRGKIGRLGASRRFVPQVQENQTGTLKTPTIKTAPKAPPPEKQVQPAPLLPEKPSGKWPDAAVYDWETWGHKEPVRFFNRWPELAPEGWAFGVEPI